jgi:acetoin utilization deacetylase AcuC-like enzyme
MKIFYTDIFPIPLPEHHSFPKDKYLQLRMRILEELGDQPVELRVPEPATDEDILRAHDPDYVLRFKNGELSPKEVRRVGLPWSAEIVKRTRYSVGGTLAACRAALEDGVAVNLGGGTHHAFPDHGQGYCWLNDIAIASRAVQAAGLVRQVLIIDCDVHQGNGTAATLKDDASIFTFSIHGKNNFPYRKEKSDLDVELPDGAQDADYLAALDEGIMRSIKNFSAELVIYLAGADPYREDRFGRLALTKEGLCQRDRLVLQRCREAELPITVTMAGGYARNLKDIVDINFQTILSALESAELRSSGRKILSKRSLLENRPHPLITKN